MTLPDIKHNVLKAVIRDDLIVCFMKFFNMILSRKVI